MSGADLSVEGWVRGEARLVEGDAGMLRGAACGRREQLHEALGSRPRHCLVIESALLTSNGIDDCALSGIPKRLISGNAKSGKSHIVKRKAALRRDLADLQQCC